MTLEIKDKEKSLGGHLGRKHPSKLTKDLRDKEDRGISFPSST